MRTEQAIRQMIQNLERTETKYRQQAATTRHPDRAESYHDQASKLSNFREALTWAVQTPTQ